MWPSIRAQRGHRHVANTNRLLFCMLTGALCLVAPPVTRAGDNPQTPQARTEATLVAGRAQPKPRTADRSVMDIESVRAAIDRGVDYLIHSQNKNGSWGGAQYSTTTWGGPVWTNPEAHRAWKVATTGLVVMGLAESAASPQADQALLHGVDYILNNIDVHRPSTWDTMHNWAFIYGVQALATFRGTERFSDNPRQQRLDDAMAGLMKRLSRYQSVHGGWGYLELDPPVTVRPQWGTSFMTASAIIAMAEAREQSFPVDDKVFRRAVHIVKRSRLPNGAFTYHLRAIPNLQSEYIDQVKGSLCRIQVCHVALQDGGENITEKDLIRGIDLFFKHHKFLDIAVHRPIPHETYYYNSGYFYLYGHYYAATVIQRLPPDLRGRYWPRLRHEVMKLQQADGSVHDYDFHNYDKPYGTAFALMALERSLSSAGSGKANAGPPANPTKSDGPSPANLPRHPKPKNVEEPEPGGGKIPNADTPN